MPTKTNGPSRMGSTFAERKAAREGAEFVPPNPIAPASTTFAERAGKQPEPTDDADSKQVDESSDVEDKAVSKKATSSKRTAKKS